MDVTDSIDRARCEPAGGMCSAGPDTAETARVLPNERGHIRACSGRCRGICGTHPHRENTTVAPCRERSHTVPLLIVLLLLGAQLGCQTTHQAAAPLPVAGHLPHVVGDAPRELRKVVLPDYVIEPPDVLVIEAVNIIPKAPYVLRAGDILSLRVASTLPDAPINGPYAIGPGGEVDLGFPYGSVPLAGLTLEQAKAAVREHLEQFLREPMAVVGLLEMSGKQQIAGEHLVAPDGTVNLGTYGRVRVVGMTVDQARAVIERHLTLFLESPEIAVDVFAYNSKVYYVITEGAGIGDTVTRFPITGGDTVLDAISNVNGLSAVSSTKIWVARPSPHCDEVQILPVDWKQVTGLASTSTNYQLMPGDRIFVAEDKLVAFDNGIAKLLAPFERVMGFTLLGTGTVTRMSGSVLRGGGNPIGQGGRF
jgi:polysaccharide biosynthesis/export protein